MLSRSFLTKIKEDAENLGCMWGELFVAVITHRKKYQSICSGARLKQQFISLGEHACGFKIICIK